MEQFHPIIQQWFAERYGSPTDIQAMAWPLIAKHENLLITAPTGSGKTLTAFLWTLNRFITGDLEGGKTRVLYISPLKALNNDIQRNLIEPLNKLRARFEETSTEFPAINVATRSGDTDQGERRRMLRKPPEILITTPESLNILLSSHGGKSILYDIETVILDEIHGVVDSKRGVYLMSAVERLTRQSGEFQRIALSATVNPLDKVAEFVAGYRLNDNVYEKRKIDILVSGAAKEYDISVRYPEAAANRGEDEKIWDHLVTDLLPRIHQNQSTLVFVNSRALCEKLTFKLNTAAQRIVAYAHHGSLSREIRTEVESRLKEGKLEAIVATSTLEMGIDIGALDEVILVQSPGSIASTIQRIGRAGHQVGAASRCTIYPTHPQDFVESAVLSAAVMEKSLEPITTINNPLDVLAQIIVSMTGTENWDIDNLFQEIRCATAFNSLRRHEFDLVINMLTGRYADRHIRELKPRVRVDRTNNRVEARKGALMSLYLSGGVIPDRGYFQLRHEGDNARIGELDEEFVWEANVGQTFSLGTQTWQVKKITHNDVIVGPGKPGSSAPPFWKAEPLNRSFHYSEKIGEFLEAADPRLDDAAFREELITHNKCETKVADEIISYLKRQRAHSNTPLPHRHHILFERIKSGPGRASMQQMVIHTGWGARVNRPFAMALEAGWHRSYGEQPEVFVANESVVLHLPHEVSASEILDLVPAERLEALLRERLEGSGFFGARFRESAGRSLLLSKGRFNQRKPLWMSRLQSQKLMDAVLKYEDFPILLETWRTCLQDEFDLDNLRAMLGEIEQRDIQVSEIDTATPSPFAQSVAWDQINTYMYMSDTPKGNKTSNLREDLLKEVVFTPALRPTLETSLITSFIEQRQRLLAGYEPTDDAELEDWIKERSFIPQVEYDQLLRQLTFIPDEARLRKFGTTNLVVSIDDQKHHADIFATANNYATEKATDPLESLLANWLQYYGPVSLHFISESLGIAEDPLTLCLEQLISDNVLIFGQLIDAQDHYYFCDAENYEYLLRQKRARSRPNVVAKPIETLTPFLFSWQQKNRATDPLDELYECLDQLRGLALPVSLWESDVIPARLSQYKPSQLDLLFQEGDICWTGNAEKRVTFHFEGDMELTFFPAGQPSAIIQDTRARYDFGALLDLTALKSEELTKQLWTEVWASQITNDSMMAVRQAGLNNFSDPPPMTRSGRGRRAAFNRWRTSTPLAGNWRQLPIDKEPLDLLEAQEAQKDRARLMLARYGIVFRELCLREAGPMKWSEIFKALRLMELSGEVVSGRFFEQIPGPQYMTPASVRHFLLPSAKPSEGKIFFLNAADPVSPSGLGLGIHGDQLPRRIVSNHLVYHGNQLVMTSARKGKDLTFYVEADAPSVQEYLNVLHHLMYRALDPVKQLRIETINGEPASSSPYKATLESRFNLYNDFKAIIVQREL